MKKKLHVKLTLRRETLHRLGLRQVTGGAPFTYFNCITNELEDCPSYFSCPSCDACETLATCANCA